MTRPWKGSVYTRPFHLYNRKAIMMNHILSQLYKTLRMLWMVTLSVGLAVLPALGLVQEKRDTSEAEATLRVNVDLVNVILSVTEGNGRLVPGLNKEDFLVEEDGRRQEPSHFAREVTLPLTIAVLIDTSPSVQSILDLEKQTAIEFLHSVLRKEDLALVMNFDRGVSLVQDFTADIRRLSKAIQSVSIGGGTSVHDAVFLASDEKLKRETGRKTIILISDGGDTTSKLKMKDAIESAQRADVIIYAISNRTGGGPLFPGGGDDGTLKRYAEATGGRAFFPSKPQDFKKAFEAIQEELRSQYILSYSSTNTLKDGSYRALKVTVPSQKNLKVRAKKGYYAAKS
ncbi:MAG: VWA domain-containing protein [Acidobacteria bacterium]|nr:VWA domain-containing protein [Acidobacteriota bacterium]